MSIILEGFQKARENFMSERLNEDGIDVMNKITALVNELGSEFNQKNGGELAEIQMKLAGYKFYLVDYVANLNQSSESLKLELKHIRAERWDKIMTDIKAVEGKVRNKEQIENVLTTETLTITREQILFENMYYRYKLKLSALDDILTAVVQQIASKKREFEQVKAFNN